MQVTPTEIADVKVVVPRRFADQRGWLYEGWNRRTYAAAGLDADFVQDNFAFSARPGTVRGLHFQVPPMAQGKLVWVTQGAIFDVAVDIRHGSPSFGHAVARTLSVENGQMLWVPPGFAHGYCTLQPDTLVLYKLTNYFSPQHERGVLWNDPALAIAWPVAEPDALIKDADRRLRPLAELPPLFALAPA